MTTENQTIDLDQAIDLIEGQTIYKVAFIRDIFEQFACDGASVELSGEGYNGLALIVEGIHKEIYSGLVSMIGARTAARNINRPVAKERN